MNATTAIFYLFVLWCVLTISLIGHEHGSYMAWAVVSDGAKALFVTYVVFLGLGRFITNDSTGSPHASPDASRDSEID